MVRGLDGWVPGVGEGVQEETPGSVLGKLRNGRSCLLCVGGDRDVGSDDVLHSLKVHSRHWVLQYRSSVATIVDAHP